MGLLLICLAAIAWGTTGTTSALIAQQVTISPLIVGLWRIVFALPIFWLWHCLNQATSGPTGGPTVTKPHHHPRLVAMGFCMAGYQVFYFAAVPYAGVAMTAMVAICASPIIIALLAVVCLGEKLHRRLMIALALGVTGTSLLIAQPDTLTIQNDQFLLGVALALGAAFSYAGYAVMAKSLVARMDSIAIATYSFTVAALVLTPTLLWQPALADWFKALPFLLYLGVVTSGIAYGIYMLGIRYTSATLAGIVVLLEPLTAALLGVFAFKEPMGWSSILGAALLISGILYVQTNTITAPTKRHQNR